MKTAHNVKRGAKYMSKSTFRKAVTISIVRRLDYSANAAQTYGNQEAKGPDKEHSQAGNNIEEKDEHYDTQHALKE